MSKKKIILLSIVVAIISLAFAAFCIRKSEVPTARYTGSVSSSGVIVSLPETYDELLWAYLELKSDYGELLDEFNTTKNLNYLLTITTIIFIATTVYLATRKPRVERMLKAT